MATLGAQFEISVDGKPRSYRDRNAVAIEASEYLTSAQRGGGEGSRKREGDGGGLKAGGGAALRKTASADPQRVGPGASDWAIARRCRFTGWSCSPPRWVCYFAPNICPALPRAGRSRP